MCLPFKHDWKDHLKVYHETRWVGAIYFIFPTRTETLGRQCTKCGKWKRYVDDAKAPQRGRVKRRGPRVSWSVKPKNPGPTP